MIVQYTCPVTLNDTWKGVQVVNTKQSSEPITNFFVSFLENNYKNHKDFSILRRHTRSDLFCKIAKMCSVK